MSNFINYLVQICDPDSNGPAEVDPENVYLDTIVIGIMRYIRDLLLKCSNQK